MTAERKRLETALEKQKKEFGGAYQATGALFEYIKTHPGDYDDKTVSVLLGVLREGRHEKRKLAYFLYREVAGATCALLSNSDRMEDAFWIGSALAELLNTAQKNCHRAVGEALGSLDPRIRASQLLEDQGQTVHGVCLEGLMRRHALPSGGRSRWAGRSLITDLGGDRVLVLKCARANESPALLWREAAWMAHLSSMPLAFGRRFDIPKPLDAGGGYLFTLDRIAGGWPMGAGLPAEPHAVAFVTEKDYFVYPNAPSVQERLPKESFREVMLRSSWLLARLCGCGIVHTAPIPLFHNRVQRDRRSDEGLYDWPKGGRLDRWIASARYPNFGMSGLRDFEHLETICGGAEFYRQVGSHLLSLILVAGSYFREDSAGFDGGSRGLPGDYRHMFDPMFFRELVHDIFMNYYAGFTGDAFSGTLPFDTEFLTGRLIEEMGVDRHMEEVLRTVDQEAMSDEVFDEFLVERGFSEEERGGFRRGAADVVALTGPHLGGFNRKISLPELIDFLESAAALCVSGRHLKTRFPGVSMIS